MLITMLSTIKCQAGPTKGLEYIAVLNLEGDNAIHGCVLF